MVHRIPSDEPNTSPRSKAAPTDEDDMSTVAHQTSDWLSTYMLKAFFLCVSEETIP